VASFRGLSHSRIDSIDVIDVGSTPPVVAQPHDCFVASTRGLSHSRFDSFNVGSTPLIVAQPHDRFMASFCGFSHSCIDGFNIGCAHSSWHNRTIASWPSRTAPSISKLTLVSPRLSLHNRKFSIFLIYKKSTDIQF
jgi:hypothetical protein